MKSTKGERILYVILLITLVMVNPPIINLVNDYAKENPLIMNYPTLWIWLQLWYLIGIIAFLVAALKIGNWNKEYEEV